jgi:hypothetical protein
MLIVPLTGDVVKTAGDISFTVLSYAPYKDAPAVYVEDENATPESLPFANIKKINGTPVTLQAGKVFKADSLVKRPAQLPQPNDTVSISSIGNFKVKSLKLRESGKLSHGLLIVGEDSAGAVITARLAELTSVARAGGSTDPSAAILRTYSEYLGGAA